MKDTEDQAYREPSVRITAKYNFVRIHKPIFQMMNIGRIPNVQSATQSMAACAYVTFLTVSKLTHGPCGLTIASQFSDIGRHCKRLNKIAKAVTITTITSTPYII
jgi:hypothetical protein